MWNSLFLYLTLSPSFSICPLSVLCLTPPLISGVDCENISPAGVKKSTPDPPETSNDQDNVKAGVRRRIGLYVGRSSLSESP